jgi:IS5 family transposase
MLKKHPELRSLGADKGYDTHDLRDPLTEHNIRPLIRHREFRDVDKAANARMNDNDYNQRQKIESVFSAIKRKYGDRISSRK